MATKERKSLKTVAPGRIVERELEARGWNLETLTDYSGLSLETVKGIIYGGKPITEVDAAGLSRAFGTTSSFWTKLDGNYRPR
jgi:HTH-type transcriptional regulator/antitoxin HigA